MFFLEPKRLGAAIDGWPAVGFQPLASPADHFAQHCACILSASRSRAAPKLALFRETHKI